MEKIVRICCESKDLLDISDLRDFQGNLKSLSETDYEKLKGEIVELGFSFPLAVWRHGEQNFILDGHQRRRVLAKMREDGWQIPLIPVSIIYAASYKEAKHKLLGAASQYGKVEGHGLYEFLNEAEIDISELEERVRFPELDLPMFKAEYYDEFNMSGRVDDAEKIPQYESENDCFMIKIGNVKPYHKELILDVVNQALDQVSQSNADATYKAEAF